MKTTFCDVEAKASVIQSKIDLEINYFWNAITKTDTRKKIVNKITAIIQWLTL
jgi:hypothetical protein